MNRVLRRLLVCAAVLAVCVAAAPPPKVSHVTIVMMENRNYPTVVGNADAPYFNNTLVPQGVLLTNAHAVSHPSEPNYLALFSGSTHGIDSDACPLHFDSANLASELAATGRTFTGYAESIPSASYDGCRSPDRLYARKHVPWTNFSNVTAAEQAIYTSLPSQMPTVAWIVPNMCNDMHDCSTQIGDRWLQHNLPPLIAWNAAHDGLLIVTWDEADPDDGGNHIPTVLVGPMVRAGTRSDAKVDLYGVLRTIESFFSLPCIAQECSASPITGVWKT